MADLVCGWPIPILSVWLCIITTVVIYEESLAFPPVEIDKCP